MEISYWIQCYGIKTEEYARGLTQAWLLSPSGRILWWKCFLLSPPCALRAVSTQFCSGWKLKGWCRLTFSVSFSSHLMHSLQKFQQLAREWAEPVTSQKFGCQRCQPRVFSNRERAQHCPWGPVRAGGAVFGGCGRKPSWRCYLLSSPSHTFQHIILPHLFQTEMSYQKLSND